MTRIPLLLTTGALALFAAGCGGDDDKDTDSAARGYDETGQAINDICKRADTEAEAITKDVSGKADKATADALGKLVELNDKYIAEVKDIVPDPKLQSAYDDFVESLDAMQAKTSEAQDAAADGDQAAFEKAAGEVQTLDEDNDRAALALGAPECATD
jgi:hypothetical protein